MKDIRNRVFFDLTEEQAKRLRDYVPWGLRSHLMQVVIDDLLNLIEKHGYAVIALIIEKKVTSTHIFSNLSKLQGDSNEPG